MATMSVMSSGGRPTDVSTITMVTRPAWGIPAAPMLAAVAVMLQDRETRMRTTEEEAEFTGPLSSCSFSSVGDGLPDGDQLSKVQLIVIDLSNKDGRHCLVQRRAVHVDGGAHREDEAGDLSVNVAVFQQTLHGDGQCGRAEMTLR